jgi:Dyp-type peroxidase family
MTIDLSKPIAWSTAQGEELTMLQGLQPNILKGHVRDFMTILFLRFSSKSGGKAFLADLVTMMKSAHDHFVEIQNFKENGVAGTPYIGLGLTHEGYSFLGVGDIPGDPSFLAGMQAKKELNDPTPAEWEAHFQDPKKLHAVVLIGDMRNDTHEAALADVYAKIEDATGVKVIAAQKGLSQHNSHGEGLEHFGYVDGRSQPLFLKEDIDGEESSTDGISSWDPTSPLTQVIVSDPAAPDPNVHFGSYFIFRKLEQNVKLFKESEESFAEALPIEDDERAGAMLVGRFEDGTPVTAQVDDGVESPVPNNFNYTSDKLGAKCPFLGHVRKTNPRGSGGFEPLADEHSHLMARRGQTYGIRADNLNDGKTENKPEKDVGLLFMAFNSDIGHQFEFTQATWANNPNFPRVPPGTPAPGVDPLIGQVANDGARPDMTSPKKWGDPLSMATVAAAPRAVTMKGGEYFFMPSLPFLQGLSAIA